MIEYEYNGGREMMAPDLWDLTERDRAMIRLRELKEEKFLRETEDFQGGVTRAFRAFLIGGLCLAVFFLLVLLAIMYGNAGV